VFDGVAVDGFVFTAVNREVCLPIAVKIEFAETNACGGGRFEYARGYCLPMPLDLARQADV
jgi:hypothetical protein